MAGRQNHMRREKLLLFLGFDADDLLSFRQNFFNLGIEMKLAAIFDGEY